VQFGARTALDDHFLHAIAKLHKLQAVAKALTAADDRVQLRFRGGVWESELQAYGFAHGNGAGNERAEAATAEAVGPAKGSGVLSVGQEGNFQTNVNSMARPTARLRAVFKLGHGDFPIREISVVCLFKIFGGLPRNINGTADNVLVSSARVASCKGLELKRAQREF